jgi:arylsulfatase A-like enzyme
MSLSDRPRATTSTSPNVVIIVLDDLGFAQLSPFGSDINTPAIASLAADGLRYNRFHVTSLCSPTRAALLAGRNHHAVGMGFLSDLPLVYPGYRGAIPPAAATLPRILRDAGYSTLAVGKWHLAPRWESSASGPFDHWPLGMGFERYYGFLAGDTNQWTPSLVRDNGAIDPPRTPEQGYHLTEDLADQALRMLRDQHQATPGRPFFLYFATGATHAPHQAPTDWIERYRGAFDDGWEAFRQRAFDRQLEQGLVPPGTVLPDRPDWVAAWSELSGDEQRLAARFMEAFAGFLSHTDAQIGRVLAGLDELGVADNTLVMLLSDNGASAEGGPTGLLNEHRFLGDGREDPAEQLSRLDDIGGFRAYNHYPWGWAWAGNTPFKLWKRYAWLGGVRTPLVIRWPGHIADVGGVRSQFAHAIDLTPTVLEAVGVAAPETVGGITQLPMDGISLGPTLSDPRAPESRHTQYFEMLGSRAIYHDGWKATTDHVGPGLAAEHVIPGSRHFDEDRWSLYRLDDDFAEAVDLADEHPDRLARLVERWWSEAGANQVLPLGDDMVNRLGALEPSPWGPRWLVDMAPGGGPVAEEVLPPQLFGFELTASVTVDDAATEGAIATLGDWSNGWALYLLEGRPVFAMVAGGTPVRLAAADPLEPGDHTLVVTYDHAHGGPSQLRLAADGVSLDQTPVTERLPFRWQIGGAGLLVGSHLGFPVHEEYQPPFPFRGVIHQVVLAVPAMAPSETDVAAEIAEALRKE